MRTREIITYDVEYDSLNTIVDQVIKAGYKPEDAYVQIDEGSVQLVVHREETDEEKQSRESAEANMKRHFDERRRAEYEKLKKEFENGN